MNIKEMVDNNNRKINYLRLSITDRCNLRCTYCMPENGVNFQPHNEILSYEEMLHIVRLAILRGIRKVRLTGGEPLIRKGFIDFLQKLHDIEGLEEITLTTNGVLLKELANDIKACGIQRLNVSLDTLKPERFLKITGRDYFDRVWEGILEAEQLGFAPIKINVVAIKGFNDDEIPDFARLTLEKPFHVRFIEIMPIGEDNSWSQDKFISQEDILDKIKTVGDLKPIHRRHSLDGPARRFILDKGKGELGVIGSLSNHFCNICNRLRLTADGQLRSCLFSDKEFDIKSLLRNGKGDPAILELIETAIKEKPKNHGNKYIGHKNCTRHMSTIGG